jgi:hypothetical protein
MSEASDIIRERLVGLGGQPKNTGEALTLKCVSVIERLRAMHPDREWKAVRAGFNRYDYVSGGWTARWVADLEDDGDVGPPSRLCIYKNDGSPELVI